MWQFYRTELAYNEPLHSQKCMHMSNKTQTLERSLWHHRLQRKPRAAQIPSTVGGVTTESRTAITHQQENHGRLQRHR